MKEVQVLFMDTSGNQSASWIPAYIDYKSSAPPPPAPGSGFATPGGSATLYWGAVADAKEYHIRYNFTNNYCEYDVIDTAPHPLTMMEGIFEADCTDTTHVFDGPQPDLYSISIWTLSKYGTYSGNPPNVDIYTHNYIQGDYLTVGNTQPGNPDGCIDFLAEFGALSASYNLSTGETGFVAHLDIAPTSDGMPTGYSMPDGDVEFEDLIIFAMNYNSFRCVIVRDDGFVGDPRGPVKKVAPEVTIFAELPEQVGVETEFVVPITISDATDVMGYHLMFEYDRTALEVVSIEPGEAYESVEQSFFYYDRNAPQIDIHSVILGDSEFDGEELALVTFRTSVAGPVTIKDNLLDVRDRNNNRLEVSFNVSSVGSALPTEFALSQNYPNPFNPTTAIDLSLPVASQYRLTIYNIVGQVVETMEGYAEAGHETLTWDASEQSSGIYLYKVQAGSFTATRKMVLLK